jgi:gamma-glutamyltranspeptidase/glutathione hydrolase
MRRRETFSRGATGAIAAAHPLAVDAGLETFRVGGNAVDAAIASQATLAVVLPHACGIGGDALALIATGDGDIAAFHGAGAAPATLPRRSGPGATVTVPGAVDAWAALVERRGRLPLREVLAPARRAAADGISLPRSTVDAADRQRARLVEGGAGPWELLSLRPGDRWVQPELASALEAIAAEPTTFYRGPLGGAIARAVRDRGGTLAEEDLAAHAGAWLEPISTPWDGGTLLVQPPMSQGVLLAMAARWIEEHGRDGVSDHVATAAIAAAFGSRDRVAEGAALLREPLDVAVERAPRRWAARSYLHTAGVATADDEGTVVSSLVSVFDEFGSGVFVPEGGFVLNDRAEGFTQGPNDARPGALPVHTLAPVMVLDRDRHPSAFATPGADGQVQTLLQVLLARRFEAADVVSALDRQRWRGQDGGLLIERGHPATDDLERRGHRLEIVEHGDMRFGGVVASGVDDAGPWSAGDGRREVATGALDLGSA